MDDLLLTLRVYKIHQSSSQRTAALFDMIKENFLQKLFTVNHAAVPVTSINSVYDTSDKWCRRTISTNI